MDNLNSKSCPYSGDNIDDLRIAYLESLNTIKNINDELEKQKQVLSDLFNFAPEPYLLLNGDGVINEVNIMGTNLFGLSNEDLVGTKLSKFVGLNSTRDFVSFLDRLANRYGADHVDLTFELPDKKAMHARVDGTSVKNNGHITHYLIVKDLTKIVEKVYTAERSKEKLEMSLEASHAGTWELEVDTMRFFLLLSNRALCPIPVSGFDSRYRTFIKYIHLEDQKKVQASFRQSIDAGVAMDVTCRFPTEDGKICYGRIKGQYLGNNTRSRSMVGILMNVTDQVLAEQRDLDDKAIQQRLISMATIQAGEKERRRISDTLHDSVSQLLYGVKLKLDLLKPQIDNPENLTEINELVDLAINDVRNISFALAPSILVEFGLPATLKELAGRLSSTKIKIKTYCFQNIERPALALELNIFRIIQELINNSIKHAEATLIEVKLRLSHEITIEVTDNGIGFNYLSQTANPSGSGLSSIKNRLSLYNGRLNVDSKLGEGTSVTIIFRIVHS